MWLTPGALQHFEQDEVSDEDVAFQRSEVELFHCGRGGAAKRGDPDRTVRDDHLSSSKPQPRRISSRSPSQPVPVIS